MIHEKRSGSALCRIALATALALPFVGTTAVVGGAQAMPIATPPAAMDGPAVTKVGYYYRNGHRYWRQGAAPRARAGLYKCGPGALRTRLQRRACGG